MARDIPTPAAPAASKDRIRRIQIETAPGAVPVVEWFRAVADYDADGKLLREATGWEARRSAASVAEIARLVPEIMNLANLITETDATTLPELIAATLELYEDRKAAEAAAEAGE